MPVDTLAGFVAAEAFEIVLGATAVAAVPVVVPILRTLSQDVRPVLRTAVVYPATKTGQVISDKLSSGINWYGEQWSDIIAEARAGCAAEHTDAMTLAGLLASLPASRVLSNTPGRVRLKVAPLKGRTDRSVFIADAVSTVPGVLRVTASPYTCSVLINYDTMCYVSLDSLLDWIVAR